MARNDRRAQHEKGKLTARERLEIPLAEAHEVPPGDLLVVLQAMKMDNALYADCDGRIGRVFV